MFQILPSSRYYSKAEDGRLPSQISHSDFNDLNMEEEGRYISHAGKCHFLGQSIKPIKDTPV